MTRKKCPTWQVTIYVAGDITRATEICLEYCLEAGLCVTVTPTSFVYTGGTESGVAVGLVNYPRFPDAPESITDKSHVLAEKLIAGLFQWSAMVVTPNETTWISRRTDT